MARQSHRLDPATALDAAKSAVTTGRERISGKVQTALEDDGWTSRDVERAIRTATGAEPIDSPEHWRITGGKGVDGERLVIEIEVLESVVLVHRVKQSE